MKKLVILHSNDIHADFFSKEDDDEMIGGIAMLAGYIKKVRSEEENVIYAIAGDIFNGSVIDSDYQGLTTLMIINHLAPDVVCVGNHEIDYGISHTLFVEKCANFPMLNANIYIKYLERRLYKPYVMLEKCGVNVLFAGVTSDAIARGLKNDASVGEYIEVRDPIAEVEKIKDTYDGQRADLAILLTHIGYEEDLKLAERIGSNPENGVDIIIGGHSHTFIDEPAIVNGVCVVQAGTGTTQIGRFDIYYDEKTMMADHYEWSVIPIEPEYCPVDTEVEDYINELKEIADQKYKRVICTLPRELTHTARNRITELCAFVADILKDNCNVDAFLLNPGAVRTYGMGPEIRVEDLMTGYPYVSEIYGVRLTVGQFRRMMEFMLNKVDYDNLASSMMQVSENIKIVFNRKIGKITHLTINGDMLDDKRIITVGMGKYMYNGMETYFGISQEEVTKNGKARIVATNDRQLIEVVLGDGNYNTDISTDRIIVE